MAEQHLPHEAHAAAPDVHHETRDANITAVFAFGIGLFVTAVVIHVMVWLLFSYFSARAARHAAPAFPLAATEERRLPPEPRLQTNPRGDLAALRAQEERTLTTYGWVDKNAGIVRIPIDEAMKLIVQRGLPARPPQETSK